MLAELRKHETIPMGCVADNPYLVSKPTDQHSRLSVGGAKRALELHTTHKLSDEEKTLTEQGFSKIVCKRLHIVEMWSDHIDKRFGSVAKNSTAMDRLLE